MNPAFLDFLNRSPEMLANFVRIVDEFYKLQRQAPQSSGPADGPQTFKAGQTHELTTKGISAADLDAMAKGYGEAIVKEKAIQYVKGFVAGVMLAV